MMNVLVWILVGAIAGWVASLIMKTDKQMGAFANIAVGIIGAFVGGWVVGLFGVTTEAGQFNFSSLLTAILGAVLLLWVIKLVRGGNK